MPHEYLSNRATLTWYSALNYVLDFRFHWGWGVGVGEGREGEGRVVLCSNNRLWNTHTCMLTPANSHCTHTLMLTHLHTHTPAHSHHTHTHLHTHTTHTHTHTHTPARSHITLTHLASFPGAQKKKKKKKIWEECLVSTVRVCLAPQVFLGNLKTTVTLVCVARPYITESQESLHLDTARVLAVCIRALHPLWKGRSSILPSQTCKLRLCMV